VVGVSVADLWCAERASALRGRVSPEALARFTAAADALPVYLDNLGLADVGPLAGSALSPNVLREVVRADGTPAVLKLVGEAQRGESATLAAWTANGVSCPALLEAGIGTWRPGVTHLLLAKADGEPLPHVGMPAATAEVCRVLASAHISPPPGVVPLTDFLSPRLRGAVPVWTAAGLPSPEGAVKSVAALPGPVVLLHGDPVGMNLLVDGAGVVLLDPVGVTGPAEFDAGCWVARCLAVAPLGALGELMDAAAGADPSLRREVLAVCVALELVIEVRHRLASAHVFLGAGANPATFEVTTSQLAEAALATLATSS